MNHSAALDEIARFDPELPLERASTPPGSWYTDPAVFALERERLFFRTWQPAARIEQLSAAGCFVADEILGEPYVVLRDPEHELRGFFNVCVHHAARIARGEGRCAELVCPYHGWRYDLRGRLTRAPGAGGMDHLAREGRALRPLATQAWGDLALVCLEAPVPRLEDWIAPLPAELWQGREPLRFVARRTYTMECNWKVFVDNYLDGGYHVAVVHPELAAGLDLDGYRTEVFARSVLQTAAAAAGARDPRLGERALYAWLYPALALNRYGPVLDVNRVVPLAPERTRVIFDFYFEEHAARDTELVERSIAESDRIQRQDAEICEAVQAGLRSRGFSRGRYAPRFEAGAHRFHALLARDLGA